MVDMVIANISGEPLKNPRELIERAALKGSRRKVPIAAAFPVNTFELVLHVKQPDSSTARDTDHKQLHEEIRLKPK